ncbi:hypothetical protein K501DRAFT_288647 [Backusella circina FSU 941]|nr:hypothetical protein K501DRAFT_288647 [Backusella circina FSU 941]
MTTFYDLLPQLDAMSMHLNGQGANSSTQQHIIYDGFVPSFYQLHSGIPCLDFQDSAIYPLSSHQQQAYIAPLLHESPLACIDESPLSYQSDSFNTHLSIGYENNSAATSPEDDALSLLFDNSNLDFGKQEDYADQNSDCISIGSGTTPLSHISIHEDEFCPNNACRKPLRRSSSVESLSPKDGSSSNYRCEYPNCTKTFTRTYNLKSHRRTHTDERPFGCSMCHKTFARQHDRNRHEKLHGGTKPYLCEYCDKSFARQDALNRHLKKDKRSRELQRANQPFLLYSENTMAIPPCLLSMMRKRNQENLKKRAAAKRKAAAAMRK